MVNWHRFTPSNFEYDFERDKLFEHRVTFNEAVECFFSDFEIRRNTKYRDRYRLMGRTLGGRRLKIIFQLKANNVVRIITGGPYEYTEEEQEDCNSGPRGNRSTRDWPGRRQLGLGDADWVKRSKPASLSLPGELAARAAFLARLHREAGIGKWVERVVRERVELEELAYTLRQRKVLLPEECLSR